MVDGFDSDSDTESGEEWGEKDGQRVTRPPTNRRQGTPSEIHFFPEDDAQIVKVTRLIRDNFSIFDFESFFHGDNDCTEYAALPLSCLTLLPPFLSLLPSLSDSPQRFSLFLRYKNAHT